MDNTLTQFAARLVPEWPRLDEQSRLSIRVNLMGILAAVAFAVGGLIWLVSATDFAVLRQNWLLLTVLAAFIVLLDEQLSFTILLSSESLGPIASSSLSPVISGSMMFLFGPSALWINLPETIVQLFSALRLTNDPTARFEAIRNFLQSVATNTFAPLCGLAVYQFLGGTFPIIALDARSVVLAAVALVIEFLAIFPLGAPYVAYLVRYLLPLMQIERAWPVIRNLMGFLALGRLIGFFGVLGSVLYIRIGIGSYVFGAVAVLSAAFIANRLSRALTTGAVRADGFRRLEALGRVMLTAQPTIDDLPELLKRETKSLFVDSRFEARLFPSTLLARAPDDNAWPQVPQHLWDQLADVRGHYTTAGLPVVGDGSLRRQALVVPINDAENGHLIGGVFIMRNRLRGPITDLLQNAQVFAEQIASALLRAHALEQQQAKLRAERELMVAGEIQLRFLPKVLPQVPGYQVAAHLDPARQASGDFYDVALLTGDKLSLTIADVADKGTGAALFMALACTLVRTYAPQHAQEPELALSEVNRRICDDTQTELFVTMLHGVLDPQNHTLYYCNAGHTPGLLLRSDGDWVTLPNRSMPLGIFNDITLLGDRVTFAPGDVLVLYTDGMTDAQNAAGELFGEARIREVIAAHARGDAQVIQRALLDAAKNWAGHTPQFDDIALLVVKRN